MTTTSLAPADSPPYFSGNPSWLGYDSADQSMWVATAPSSVDIVPMNANAWGNVSDVIPVGTRPFGVAADASKGDVFVTNTGSDNVSVVSDTSQLPESSIGVGNQPMGIAFDSTSGEIYVANEGSNSVAVISDATLKVVANVYVGFSPIGVAFDSATGDVFVANFGSYSVSVISGATHTVVATVPTGVGPYGVAVDNATDNIYVTNQGSDNVTVIQGSTDSVLTTIPVVTSAPTLLQGIAYDSRTDQLWVGAGFDYLVVLNATAQAVAYVYSTDPSGVAYDPDTGAVCATNSANATFECFALAKPITNTIRLTFTESGLPPGTPWNISVRDGPTEQSDSSQAAFSVVEHTYYSWVASEYAFFIPAARGYVALDPTPTVAIGASPVFVAVSFRAGPAEYPVRFNETGLATGEGWNVVLNNTLQASTGSSITFFEPNGSYGYSLGSLPTYSVSGSENSLTVGGAPVSIFVAFEKASPPGTSTENSQGVPGGLWWALAIVGVGTAYLVTVGLLQRRQPPFPPDS
ncbi:MAG: YncE family protein [Thermoplasmata archaeon]|nr:YncE family protein [Thermoplasmata archaeon]